jgi:hypothetical protein
LLEQEPSPLASSLGHLREHGPDAAELASLASRLALRGLDVSPARPVPLAKPWKKWTFGGFGAASAVVFWLALRGSQPSPSASTTEPPPHPAVANATSLTAPPSVVPPGTARPNTVDGSRAVASSSAAAALVTGSEVVSAPVVDSTLGSAPPSAEATSPDAGAATSLAPPGPTRARSATGSSGAPGAVSGAPPATGGTPALSEIELLRDARLALRQSPARALELTDEHARQYPRGKLTQERELIAVSALVALGRRTAAMSRAAHFERLNPTSPYRKQMGDLLR